MSSRLFTIACKALSGEKLINKSFRFAVSSVSLLSHDWDSLRTLSIAKITSVSDPCLVEFWSKSMAFSVVLTKPSHVSTTLSYFSFSSFWTAVNSSSILISLWTRRSFICCLILVICCRSWFVESSRMRVLCRLFSAIRCAQSLWSFNFSVNVSASTCCFWAASAVVVTCLHFLWSIVTHDEQTTWLWSSQKNLRSVPSWSGHGGRETVLLIGCVLRSSMLTRWWCCEYFMDLWKPSHCWQSASPHSLHHLMAIAFSFRLEHGSHLWESLLSLTPSIKLKTKWFGGNSSAQEWVGWCGSGESTCRLHFGQLNPFGVFCPLVVVRICLVKHSLQKEWRHGSPTGCLNGSSHTEHVRKVSATSGSMISAETEVIFCKRNMINGDTIKK